jgi:hypothetical protein
MAIRVRNLPDLKAQDQKLWETVTDIVTGVNNVAAQANADPGGEVPPPIAPQAVNVIGQDGIFDAAITDHSANYKGVEYFLEHSTTSSFSNPIVIHVGTSRNWRGSLGNQTLYWRAYSQYPTSQPSSKVYHGGTTTPMPVIGGGVSGPPLQTSQGSGTDNLGGYGVAKYKGALPPTRGKQ